ncbi:siphovirus Gp157 family protein [Schleiferilactobacillus harbinensis]|uniref:siphovirus Gp157 family protein n=1 Tax=Schleiferilactobacillus harbinensis TaxID=304207 RepID=UPI0039EB9FB4
MTSLYNLTGAYARVKALATDPDSYPEAIKDTLSSIKDGIEDKAVGYAYVIKSVENDIAAVDAEIKRLNDRRRGLTSNRDRLKQALTDAFQAAGINKVKTPTLTVWIQASTSVQVPDDYRMLPPQFVTKKVTHVVDKRSIKAALESGTTVVGAELKTNWSPRIR